MCIQKLTLSCPTSTMSADGDGRRKNYKKRAMNYLKNNVKDKQTLVQPRIILQQARTLGFFRLENNVAAAPVPLNISMVVTYN